MKDFDKLISKDLVLVDFSATWCGPCKMLEPVLEELSKEYNLVKIDVDENEDLANRYRIFSIPTIIIFKDGKEIERIMGYHSKEDIIEEIEKVC